MSSSTRQYRNTRNSLRNWFKSIKSDSLDTLPQELQAALDIIRICRDISDNADELMDEIDTALDMVRCDDCGCAVPDPDNSHCDDCNDAYEARCV